MFQKVLIIANPGSGKNKAPKYAEKLATLLKENYQSQIEIKLTEKQGDATTWAKDEANIGFDTVICLGGDGTVNETVTGVLENKNQPYFAFIPLGTVNDLGRAIGYSMNPDEAIQQFSQVESVGMDVAKVNEQIFINVLAIGTIPESVMNTESDDKNKLGVFAYVKDAVESLFDEKAYRIKLTVDEQTKEITTNLMICALTNSVGGFEQMVKDATINDGKVHLLAINGTKPTEMAKAFIEGAIEPNKNEHFVYLSGRTVTIESLEENAEIISNIDGDKGPKLPLHIEVLPSAITVLAPK